MRQNNNKRMRGRSSNSGNRRAPNPLTRSFESNGPDVKVRGTAQHVAEKYTQLARDAHTSGDRVAAENYLQHAEHYFRIIAAAHLAQQARESGVEERDDGEDEEFDTVLDRFTFRAPQSAAQQNGNGQPYPVDRAGGEFNGEGEQPEGEATPNEQPRERAPFDRQSERERFPQQDRRMNERRAENGQPQRFDRNRERDRGRNNQDRGERQERGERNFRPRYEGEAGGERPFTQRTAIQDAQSGDQPVLPAFLTAPVRAIPLEVVTPVVDTFVEGEGGEGRSQFRARRPRRRIAVETVGESAPLLPDVSE